MGEAKRPYYHRKLASQGKVPKKYRKYSLEKRQKLLEEVKSKPVAKAARQLGIANTSARLIIKTFESKGHIFEKKADAYKRKIRLEKEAERQAQQRRNIQNQRSKKESKIKQAPEVKIEVQEGQASENHQNQEPKNPSAYQLMMLVPAQVPSYYWIQAPLISTMQSQIYPLLGLEKSYSSQ